MATGVVARRTSLRWLMIVVLFGMAAAIVARNPLDARGQEPGAQIQGLVDAGLIAPKVAEGLAANGGVDAILVLNDSAVHAAFETTKRDAGISDDTDQIREAKALAFASMKAGVAQSAGPGMTVLRDYDHIATQFVHFDSAAALAGAAADARTLAIVENGENFATMAESMPLIQQPLAQLSGRIGTGAAVAVLDTGLDYTLPFFGCTAVNTPANTCKVVHVADTAPNDGVLDAVAQGKHGTNVTGNVSAVAPGAKLLNFDVFDGASAFNADVLTALNAIIANTSLGGTPIKAVNMSIGDSQHVTSTCAASYATAAFASLRTAGVIPVVAAANGAHVPNDGPYVDGIAGPACTPGALSVGAVYDSNVGAPGWQNCPSFDLTTAADQITCFSQSASILGMLAPGAFSDVGPIQQGGTSQAAPKVAGAVAVLAAAAPSQTLAQREASLTGSGPSILDTRNNVSKHRLDLCAALINAGSSCPGGTSNDNRVNATPITASPALFRQSTYTFTTEGSDPIPSCGIAGNQNSKSAWFKIETGSAGTLIASTVDSHYPTEFGNDTVMAVYQDNAGTLSQVACSDDIDALTDNYYSAVNVGLQGNKTYLIEVTAWGATSGNIGGYLVLNVSYSGTFGAGGPTTDSLAWTGQPANRGVGEALPNLTLEARNGGALNNQDNSTAITLSLIDDGNPFQLHAVGDDFQVVGTVQPNESRATSLRQQFAGRGSVRARFADDGTLASLVGLTKPLTDPSGDTPEQIARRFMDSLAGARGIEPGFDSTLRVQKIDDAGMTTIGYSQEIDGLPVYDAYAKVNIAPDGSVVAFSTTLLGGGSVIQGASSITEPEAIAAAEAAVGPNVQVEVTDTLSAEAQAQFRSKTKVMAYSAGDDLSVGFVVFVSHPDEDFMVLVDAFTGAVIESTSLTAEVGPEGTIFPEHPDAGPRATVPFQGTVPNHTTWVTTGQTGGWTCPVVVTPQPCLIGNNVATILARNGTTGPGFFTAYNALQEFNFPFSDAWNLIGLSDNPAGTALNNDYPATLATLFYFNNFVHDWLYGLGFDEAAGNFQHTNVGGGAASDSVNSFAQYGANICDIPQSNCRNNANFSTFPDGQEGIMRMYLFNAASNGSPRRDGSLDGDVVVHEYGHGVSNRLVDPVQANGLQGTQARAMGEGWSDFFAFSMFDDPRIGEYVTTNTVNGIRTAPYNNHPWTYSHLCQTDFGQGPVCEEHRDGEIWAATLWDMRDALMTAGRTSDQVVKLVLDGLKVTPELPSFLQARDAIIAANLATNGGANACLIWQAFADRGMGTNAQNDGNNDESAVDGFNVPAECNGANVQLTNCTPLTHTVASGTTTWTGCTIGTAGTYRIAASATGLTTVNSNQFVIGAGGGSGPATKLAFSGQPSNGISALALPGQPQVQIQDANSQLVTSSNATVTLELVAPPTLQAPPVPPESESRQPLTGKDSLLPIFLESSTPTDQWAVWLVPGSDPSTVAAALGAVYVQPATPLENTYIFEFPGASGFADPAVVAALEGSTAVYQYEQQVIVDTASRTLPTDPGIGSQWHIKNTGQGGRTAGVDINVEPAWDAGFTGTGVVVGIIDDGVQIDHPDISPGYNAGLSFDYFGTGGGTPVLDSNPSPEGADNHGTSVAGLVGGQQNNGVCGVGAAYDATLAGIRGGGKAVTSSNEAAMLIHQLQSIAIYNNSWGPSDNGKLGAIGALSLASIQTGVTTGRGGLGNIYVWAGGNGRTNNDNVAYDGYASLRQVIAVGAIEGTGIYSSYSEPGAPLLISTPGGTLAGDIYTTDRTGANGYTGTDCMPGFNGTSSAAPIAAGAMAVILQANPNLTYRDMQHILVRTATKVNPSEADWTVNGAGRPINHNYGFGLLNTNAARLLAQGWTNVGPEQSATSGLQSVNAAIPDNSNTGVTRVVTMPGTLKIEHVELVFNATHAFRGDLEVTLTSPSGTVSKLAQRRIQDNGANYTNWKFTTTRDWDETVAGNWTVTVKDLSAGTSGTWDNFTLNFFGTIPTGAGPATLTCEGGLSKAAVNGVASFTGCKVTGDGEGYTIRATATALTQATSNAFNITDPDFDATCNGSLDAGDSLAVLRQLAGLPTGGVTAPCTGDANKNTTLAVDDAILIRRRVAGLP